MIDRKVKEWKCLNMCRTAIMLVVELILPAVSSGVQQHYFIQPSGVWEMYLLTAWVPTSISSTGLCNTPPDKRPPNKRDSWSVKWGSLKSLHLLGNGWHEIDMHYSRKRHWTCQKEWIIEIWTKWEWERERQKEKKQAACAMCVKLTPLFPGGKSPCCLWQHVGGDEKQSWRWWQI